MNSSALPANDTEALLRDIGVDNETASLAAAELEGLQIKQMEGVTIYSGRHKEHGNIHIVIPALGEGMLLLPFAIRDF